MKNLSLSIKKVSEKDQPWIKKVALKEWGGEFCAFLNRKFYLEKLPGFYLEDTSQKKLGLITYEIRDQICEIMTFNAFFKHKGFGTILLKRLIEEANQHKCNKIIVRTTNDNLDALRFYQKRGFIITHLYKNALKADLDILSMNKFRRFSSLYQNWLSHFEFLLHCRN